MKKIQTTGLILAIATLAVVLVSSIEFVDAPKADAHGNPVYTTTCGLQAKDGRIIVDFKKADGTYARLVNPSNQSFSKNVSIPAGKYKITAVSFDGYATRANTDVAVQDHEQWDLVLYNDTTKLNDFGPTIDLPDRVTRAYSTTTLATGAVFTQSINKLTVKHAFMNLSPEPHSVAPVCIAFDKIETPPAVCTLTVSDNSITKGQSTTLRWTSDNATSFSINQGIGGVNLDGSRSVSPATTTTYTATATNGAGATATCTVKVTVTTPPPAPSCTLTVNDNSIIKGQSAKITWTTTNATSFSINQGIGSVALNGNRNVSPTATTTYTGTVTNSAGKIATCAVKIVVTPPAPQPCDCTLSASKTTIKAGEKTTLSWNSQNAVSATMNNGVGSIPVSDTREVSPTTTTTYTITVTGADGKKETCTVTIVVEQVKMIPVCALEPRAGRIIVDFKKADGTYDVLFNPSKQSLSKNAVIPAGTYVITAESFDGYSNRANTPASSQNHEQWNLELWSNTTKLIQFGPTEDLADNVTSAREVNVLTTNGILPGGITKLVAQHAFPHEPVPDSVYPVCVAFDIVDTPTDTVPQCTLDASRSSVFAGENVTLSWTSALATTGSLTDIGAIALNGSAEVTVDTATTYTATFRDADGDEVTCTKRIEIKEPPVSYVPQCTLSLSAPSFERGSASDVRLSWTSANVTTGFIDNGVGTVTPNGEIDFVPNKETLYTGTFGGAHGTTTCSARITMTVPQCTGNCGGGGGGYDQPNVSLVKRDLPPETPLAFVYLSQVPYTGFEAGPFTTALYWFVLVLLSGVIAYYIVIKNILWTWTQMVLSAVTFKRTTHSEMPHIVASQDDQSSSGFVPANLPVGDHFDRAFGGNNGSGAFRTSLEVRAEDEQVLMSPEALDMLSVRTDASEVIEEIIPKAKMLFPREDGWILLNRERMQVLLSSITTSAPVVAENETNAHVEAITARYAEAVAPTPAPVPTPAPSAPVSTSVAGFVSAIAEGKEEEAFHMIRSLQASGKAHEFMMQVITALDDIYKNRLEGGKKVDARLAEKTGALSNTDLEELLSIIVGGVDYSYTSPLTAAKIAVAKAIEFFGKKNK